ncbi:hypothetical protein B0H12DRAFT_1240813 [Mycena haematopus]|nr:hypothetical protein B0H12DRAFT_1240813 [Mycena haematopus]
MAPTPRRPEHCPRLGNVPRSRGRVPVYLSPLTFNPVSVSFYFSSRHALSPYPLADFAGRNPDFALQAETVVNKCVGHLFRALDEGMGREFKVSVSSSQTVITTHPRPLSFPSTMHLVFISSETDFDINQVVELSLARRLYINLFVHLGLLLFLVPTLLLSYLYLVLPISEAIDLTSPQAETKTHVWEVYSRYHHLVSFVFARPALIFTDPDRNSGLKEFLSPWPLSFAFTMHVTHRGTVTFVLTRLVPIARAFHLLSECWDIAAEYSSFGLSPKNLVRRKTWVLLNSMRSLDSHSRDMNHSRESPWSAR